MISRHFLHIHATVTLTKTRKGIIGITSRDHHPPKCSGTMICSPSKPPTSNAEFQGRWTMIAKWIFRESCFFCFWRAYKSYKKQLRFLLKSTLSRNFSGGSTMLEIHKKWILEEKREDFQWKLGGGKGGRLVNDVNVIGLDERRGIFRGRGVLQRFQLQHREKILHAGPNTTY